MSLQPEASSLQLTIRGIGTQYPSKWLTPNDLRALAARHYPDTSPMHKVLAINEQTGIKKRSAILTVDHPILNQATPASIDQLHALFLSESVPLAVKAARKALAEAKLQPSEITHIISTTCTDTANPGYDHLVAKELGLSSSVEKVLLHGVGCSGGLAALRTAANLALGHSFRSRPARILCVALEMNTPLARSELDRIHVDQEVRLGVCLFSDGASAVVLSNGLGTPATNSVPVYSLLDWQHETLPDSQDELGFDVDPHGWKVILTPAVPTLTAAALPSSFDTLSQRAAAYLPSGYEEPSDFDWAIHPGGTKILVAAQKVLSLTPGHMRASYDVYRNHGNTSSATIFSVLDRHRQKDMDAMAPDGRAREFIVACAFGPGITVETCLLKRYGLERSCGVATPPLTDGEADLDDGASA